MNYAIVDFETTSLDLKTAEIVQGAIALYRGVTEPESPRVERYDSLHNPAGEITPDAIKIHGITREKVSGHVFDWSRFRFLAEDAEVIVAHNASFDRHFARRFGDFSGGRWACSLSMIDWEEQGLSCKKLQHLVWEHGGFSVLEAHDASADIEMLNWLLCQPTKADHTKNYLSGLLEAAHGKFFRASAVGAPFDKKDVLKKAGFQWNPDLKVWSKVVPEKKQAELSAWMKEEVYKGRTDTTIFYPVDPTVIS